MVWSVSEVPISLEIAKAVVVVFGAVIAGGITVGCSLSDQVR